MYELRYERRRTTSTVKGLRHVDRVPARGVDIAR
jgi:hypothetical protein